MAPLEPSSTRGIAVEGSTLSLSEPLICPADDENDAVAQCRESSATIVDDQVQSPRNDNHFRERQASRNVRLTLAFTFLYYAGRSLWNQNVLATFIYILRDGNPEAVGYITCVMGLCQMIVAFPTGYLADRYRRDKILQISAVAGIVAISTTLVATYKSSYHYTVVALATWGIAGGMFNPSLSAIFADSVPEGKRSYYFTRRAILTTLGNVTGPLVALFMFLFLGDQWTIHDCSTVMAVGQVISVPGILLLCCFNDHDDTTSSRESSVDPLVESNQSQLEEPLLSPSGIITAETNGIGVSDGSNSNSPQAEASDMRMWHCCIPSDRLTPSLIAMADVTAGLASGMSIRYFAVFLYDNLGLSPVIVQSLYVVTPLLQASLMKIARLLSICYGRCHVAACFKWTGIMLMICMVISYSKGLPTWFVCLMIVIRTAFMNSTSALTKSVLMDAVPRDERAKWSSLESLNMFSWSGSAALGGFLVAYQGIIFNFCVTAFLQLLATIPLVILFPNDNADGQVGAITIRSELAAERNENASVNEEVPTTNR